MPEAEQDVMCVCARGFLYFVSQSFLIDGLSVCPSVPAACRVVVVMPGLVKCLIPMFCYHVKAAETVLTCILRDFCISVLSICVLFVRFVNIYNENPK